MPTATQQPFILSPVTDEDMGELKVSLPTLKVISYRGPGESGGVSISLEPIVRQLGTTVHWIALSGIPSIADSRIPGFRFYKSEPPRSIVEGHARAASEYLFPLLHGMPERATFDVQAWRSFRQLSEIIATKSLRIASDSFPTLCWLHDYHMALVAPLLSLEAGIIPCQFWHVPWPSAEIIKDSPIGKEITEALLCNKVIGFHTQEYATNFLNSVQEMITTAQVDVLKMEVRVSGRTIKVVVMPLGLDFSYWQRLARTARPKAAAIPKKYALANQLVLGVDRLDYSKGIVEKLQGIEEFLQCYPDWQRRFHYIQLSQPPQSQTRELLDYAQIVKCRVAEINKKYHLNGWEPIVFREGHWEHADLAAWYQSADALLVTPIRDGLNLIAKEYVASRLDEQGALILSRRAGCASELSTGALLIDPGKPGQIADAIAQALSLPVEEKRRRMHSMRHVVSWNQLHDWACGFLRTALL